MNQENNKTKKDNQNHKENELLHYKKPNQLTRARIENLPNLIPLKMFYGGVAIHQKQKAQGKKGRFIKYPINQFIDIVGGNKKKIINKVKNYQRELLDFKIFIEQGDNLIAINFINKIFYENKGKNISIFFNENIDLWNVKNNWNSNLLSNIRQYKSKYSIIFYELIKAYIKQDNKGMGKVKISIKDLKDLLGVSNKITYENFHNLKKNILNRAIKEMETIHKIKLINLETTKEKGSTKIKGLIFTFDYSREITLKKLTPKGIIKKMEVMEYQTIETPKAINLISNNHLDKEGEQQNNKIKNILEQVDLEQLDFNLAIDHNPYFNKNKGNN